MSMQQRPTRFYITQEEDHTVVRTVPMARRARSLTPHDERPIEHGTDSERTHHHQSMADRLRLRIRKPVKNQ